MTQIPVTVQCSLPGFETFAVTYNVWASNEDVERVAGSIGEPADFDRSGVIMDMHGWPETEYPGGPFGKKAPLLMSIWVCRDALRKAFAEYANSPNWMTGS